MKKTKLIIGLLVLLVNSTLLAQTVELSGVVTGEDNVENIHILNKTALTNATSGKQGEFKIKAKLNDTIVFTSVQYKMLVKVVTKQDVLSKTLNVTLEVFTNQLDEVFITKPLSGNLSDDISNSTAKPKINFYDVGIPGYQGKQKTHVQKQLYEADHGKFVYVGLGAAVNFYKLLNTITGRTKKLKQMVKLENNDALLVRLKNDLAEDFFKTNPLDKKYHVEFFYFVQEDPLFKEKCGKSNLEALAFFKLKLKQYKQNLSEKE
ncbi:hypothetical protein [Olleya sp. ITB9]|uniref:hypothetical protein n=1 Tax=Olleya sp. ITB9 TaxID=1715648 RepID=UPI0006CF2E50|nr:hypothetical protein [Olleya sp. ITB9]